MSIGHDSFTIANGDKDGRRKEDNISAFIARTCVSKCSDNGKVLKVAGKNTEQTLKKNVKTILKSKAAQFVNMQLMRKKQQPNTQHNLKEADTTPKARKSNGRVNMKVIS